MNFLRKKGFTLAAGILSLIIMLATVILTDQFKLDENIIFFGLIAAAVVTVLLIVIDILLFNGKKDDEEITKEMVINLDTENNQLSARLREMETEKETLMNEVLDSRKTIEQMKSDAEQQSAVTEELKERVLELNNKLSIAKRTEDENADVQASVRPDMGQDYSTDVYCTAVSQWAMDLVKPLRTVKRFAETCDNREVAREAEQLSTSVEKILYFSSIDNIQTTVKNDKIVLNDLLRDILKKYSAAFNEKKIGIFRKGLENTIVTDKVWFVFGFSQLINNALYSTGDFGKISIMAKEDEQYVYLLLEDSSMGIHEEEMAHIFEPGFVSEEARRISGNTTSTCLYLAKKAFDKIGVPISVESVYGKGTKVIVRFNKVAQE